MAKSMWVFRTKNFVVQWLIEPDVFSSEGMDGGLVAECRAKLRSGEWKCFQSEVRVMCRDSAEVLGASYLGNSIYANPAEFRDHIGMNERGHGSYFSDMVREAVAQARQRFPLMQEGIRKDIEAKQKLLIPRLRNSVRQPSKEGG